MDKLVSLQAARLRLPVLRDLRRAPGSVWDYGPLGVELKKNLKDRWWHAMVHAPGRHRGLDAAILMHPRVWEAVGTSRLHRSAGGLPRTARTVSGPTTSRSRAQRPQAGAQSAGGTRAHADRGRAVQPHVQDVHGAGRGERGDGLPRPETAQGIFVNFLNVQQARAEGAVRHRADRQGVSQRDHARELHLPDARVRADGDAVLRGAGHRRGALRVLARGAHGMVPVARACAGSPALHSRTSSSRTTRAAADIEFDFGGSLGFQEIEGIHNRSSTSISADTRSTPARS